MLEDHARRQVGHEPFERITDRLALLSHQGGPHHPPQRVERGVGAVAVRIRHPVRPQHAIIDPRPRDVADRVARLDRHQVVRIVGDVRVMAERVAEPPRHEEVPDGLGMFGHRIVPGVRRIEDSPRRHPRPAVAVNIDISTRIVEEWPGIGQPAAVDLSDQAGRQQERITLAGQRQRVEPARRQQVPQVVAAVARARPAPMSRRNGRGPTAPAAARSSNGRSCCPSPASATSRLTAWKPGRVASPPSERRGGRFDQFVDPRLRGQGRAIGVRPIDRVRVAVGRDRRPRRRLDRDPHH